MSLRLRLLVGLLAGLTPLLAAAGVAVWARTRAVLTREFDAALRAEAARVVADTEYDEDGKLAVDAPARPDVFFQLWLPDGQTIGRSANLEFNDLPRREGDVKLPDGRPGRAMLLRFAPAPAEDEQPVIPDIPEVTLAVARDRVGLDRALAGVAGGLALVGALALALTAAVVSVAVRRGLAPLEALGRQIATSTLQTRFEPASAELRPIAERLNDLLTRLDEAFQRERRVTANIAHELRTPIAELRAMAELPEAASWQDALEIARRMETMVAGLLALARHEAGLQPLANETVDLRQLIEEIPLSREVSLDVNGAWRTDPVLLRLIIGNLLANAVEYTPEHGQIRVTANDSQLEITNTTDKLTREDLPHLFERFWRKDAARTGAGHSGLGLSLAQAAANALGLKLVAEMPDDATLRLTLRGNP